MTRIGHELRVLLLALLAGLPGSAIALYLLWTGGFSSKVFWTLALLIAGIWLGAAYSLRENVAGPLRTLANLLEAMREGDFSIRARTVIGTDALSEAMQQVNAIGETLHAQRLGALEATALLRKVMEEIDVGVFAFDEVNRLQLVNRAGARLLVQPTERLLQRDAEALGLSDCLTGDFSQTIQRTFPSGAGRWGISRSSFREGGKPHQMLVITDLTRALREEELLAWQRLVRVLGHELNNSLTPIKSIAGSLETIVKREPLPEDWRDDMARGLSVIASRSEALSRFTGAYAKLAGLPRPVLAAVSVGAWVERTARLETRLQVSVETGPPVILQADGDQLDQLLINLLRNAADASLETGSPKVSVSWKKVGAKLELLVKDEGLGLSGSANLFVPFFTTKPSGSGIGLVLSRQIAEAHGGQLTLQNRTDGSGCVAQLELPLYFGTGA